ncbi:glycosyltransferase family 4 protein [Spirochaetia bacterium 38H-sp]|uniref:Glycosyltransferase family 4 protein n=1 Tax=Rarispira pelagica TaxID=3141764 RepID=A0ABU9U9V8_9SPIR
MQKSSMKTIAFSGNTAWSMYNFRIEVMRAFKAQGYRVIVVAPYDIYIDKLKKEFEVYSVTMDNDGTNPFVEIRTLFDYYKLYKKIRPDFIFHYTIKPNIYGSVAAHLLKIPSLSVVTGLGYAFTRDRFIKSVVKRMYKWGLKYPEKVWFLNSDDKKLFIDNGLIDVEKADILPGEGIDPSRFFPGENEKKDKTFNFLFIARLLWDKGVLEYVSAARELKKKYKNINFLVLGPLGVANPTAVPQENLQQWIDEGLINYLGTTDDVREKILIADCVVLPTFYREGLPRVLLEALSMKKPVIATDAPGCRDIVEDGKNGYICKLRDIDDLADKMEKMLALTQEERYMMGEYGRKKILENFSISHIINIYFDFISSVL